MSAAYIEMMTAHAEAVLVVITVAIALMFVDFIIGQFLKVFHR